MQLKGSSYWHLMDSNLPHSALVRAFTKHWHGCASTEINEKPNYDIAEGLHHGWHLNQA
jgi:hypothetical protein